MELLALYLIFSTFSLDLNFCLCLVLVRCQARAGLQRISTPSVTKCNEKIITKNDRKGPVRN